MAGLPSLRSFHTNKLMKCYMWRYVSVSVRKLSSKDIDENSTKNESHTDKNKGEDQTKGQDLNTSSKKLQNKQGKETAKKKLFSLLSEIKVIPDQPKIKPGLDLAKPLKRPKKTERFQHLIKKEKSPDEEMKMAISAVAKSIGKDEKETEVELSKKLSSLNLMQENLESDEKMKTDIIMDEKVQEDLMTSVKDIASTVTIPTIKSKLTQRLLRLSLEKKERSQAKIPVEDMVKGMKIEKSSVAADKYQKQSTDVIPRERRIRTSKIKLFQSAPLDIFSLEESDHKEGAETQSQIWKNLEKKKLKLLTEFAPANAFEEMILWTEQGKHWKFPIDNEIDMGDEENVGFHEHVFLEQHLHDFPKKGPIRHFMELVIVGLSKNPYITVERKIENIDWFREYFKDKEDILKEYGAI